jgi:hypothetical protein
MNTTVFVVLAVAAACAALPAAGEDDHKWFCNQELKYACRPFTYIYNDNRWCARLCRCWGVGGHTHTGGSNTLTTTTAQRVKRHKVFLGNL